MINLFILQFKKKLICSYALLVILYMTNCRKIVLSHISNMLPNMCRHTFHSLSLDTLMQSKVDTTLFKEQKDMKS